MKENHRLHRELGHLDELATRKARLKQSQTIINKDEEVNEENSDVGHLFRRGVSPQSRIDRPMEACEVEGGMVDVMKAVLLQLSSLSRGFPRMKERRGVKS